LQQKTFKNGLKAVLVPFKSSAAGITFGADCHIGKDFFNTIHERHILEHIMSRATKRHPSWESLCRYSEGFCEEFNAETDRSSIIFHCKTTKQHLAKTIGFMSEIALLPHITATHVNYERKRIAEEAWEIDVVENGLFGRMDCSVDNAAIHNIKDAELARKLRGLHRRLFTGHRSVIAIAGDFDQKKANEVLEKKFQSLKTGTKSYWEPYEYTALQGKMMLDIKKEEKIDLTIAFPTFGFTDPDRFTMSVIRNHLVSRYSSRFGIRLESVGAGSIGDTLWFWKDAGYFAMHISMLSEHFFRILSVVFEEINLLKEKLIEPEDLEQAVNNINVRGKIRFSEPLETSKFYARQVINHGRAVSLRAYQQQIQQVTRPAIRKTARNIFVESRMVLHADGPLRGVRKNDIRKALWPAI